MQILAAGSVDKLGAISHGVRAKDGIAIRGLAGSQRSGILRERSGIEQVFVQQFLQKLHRLLESIVVRHKFHFAIVHLQISAGIRVLESRANRGIQIEMPVIRRVRCERYFIHFAVAVGIHIADSHEVVVEIVQRLRVFHAQRIQEFALQPDAIRRINVGHQRTARGHGILRPIDGNIRLDVVRRKLVDKAVVPRVGSVLLHQIIDGNHIARIHIGGQRVIGEAIGQEEIWQFARIHHHVDLGGRIRGAQFDEFQRDAGFFLQPLGQFGFLDVFHRGGHGDGDGERVRLGNDGQFARRGHDGALGARPSPAHQKGQAHKHGKQFLHGCSSLFSSGRAFTAPTITPLTKYFWMKG